MELSYMYPFNRERYRILEERELPCRKQLYEKVVEQGYLLPNRYAEKRLFGHGGVLNSQKKYVKESEMNAYAKYAVSPGNDQPREIYLGEGYEIDETAGKYLDEDIVYLGYINNHWGHFLIDCSTRLYYFLKDEGKKYKYAFLVNESEDYHAIAPIQRFFELLGIEKKLIFVNQVTKCRKIIIPEQGYMINGYYSEEYLNVFSQVADQVDCSKYSGYEKVYYSRNNFKKAQGSEVGEEILLDLFKKNGFKIISPENCSLDEQIATIRNTRFLAGIIGTLGHNMLFARPNQNMLLINKTYNVNVAQMDINQIKKIDMTYIDSYLAEFPTLIGNGPFLLIYSQMLKKYVEEQGWKLPDEKYICHKELKSNLKKYERMYRLMHTENLMINFEKNQEQYDYYDAEHLTMFYETAYAVLNPIKWNEKIEHWKKRITGRIKRITG